MITIINYGSGNIRAFANVYKQLNIPVNIATQCDDLKTATKIILPGVGAFDHAMERLEHSGMRQTLDELVLKHNTPVLGVCVGMQMFACSSEEGRLPGLGWVDGVVKKMDPTTLLHATRLPHMGWNDVQPTIKNSLFRDFDQDSRFYFLHSYSFHCNKKEEVLALTDYGGPFASAVSSGNIYGVQFHPEKSHQCGIQLLNNFATL